MRMLVLAAVLLVCSGAREALAQEIDPRCTDPAVVGAGLNGGDGCQKVVDLFHYMTPQLGLLIAGGNATLGQGGVLGGLGNFLVGGRVNALRASLPNLVDVGVTAGPPQSDAYTTSARAIPMPVLDASIGILRGFPVGATHTGGLDILLSALVIPEVRRENLAIELDDGPVRLGWGVRVGLIEETIALPAVSLTWIRRDLPRLTMMASVDDDTVTMRRLDIRTTAWRVVASKNLIRFTVGGGIGQDRYSSRSLVTYVVRDAGEVYRPDEEFPLRSAPTRTNMFVDASVNLARVRLLGEIGRVSGGNIRTYNQFSPRADAPRFYGTVGLRFELR